MQNIIFEETNSVISVILNWFFSLKIYIFWPLKKLELLLISVAFGKLERTGGRNRSAGRRIHHGRRLRNTKDARSRRWGTRKEPWVQEEFFKLKWPQLLRAWFIICDQSRNFKSFNLKFFQGFHQKFLAFLSENGVKIRNTRNLLCHIYRYFLSNVSHRPVDSFFKISRPENSEHRPW